MKSKSLIFFFILLGCSANPQISKDKIERPVDIQRANSDKPTIESLLKSRLNTLNNGLLNVCCSNLFSLDDLIEYDNLSLKKQFYKMEDEKEKVLLYEYKSSFFKVYSNAETDTDDIVLGEITDSDFPFKEIEIGMEKVKFLDQIFEQSKLYNQVDSLVISSDESGDFQTIYIFKKGFLEKIFFKSSYDWIDDKR